MAADNTINDNFFKVIDNPLKGYILGLVAFNNTNNIENLNVEIKLNNIKEHDNIMKNISYCYYKDLKAEEKRFYSYFNNIDMLINYLRQIGDVKYTELGSLNSIIKLNITSQKIKDDISVHLNIIDCRSNDLSAFIADCYSRDENICNQFVKAYIEKYASIIYDVLNITFYNENTANSIIELYNIPYIRQKSINNHVIQYNSVNMIDLLGMIYSNCDLHVNNYIYTYNNYDGNSIPSIKVFTDDESAVIPSKSRYSDAGYDLTIIKEYKRLTSNTVIYDTGIKLEIPNGYYVEIVPRSSISKSGYILANNVGIIDQGYRGNLYVALTKINNDCPDLNLPFRCCQMIVKKQIYSKLVICNNVNDDIEKSNRGTGAFGSSG
jgi:deoxyuridine 5'-triphosphate nucleotidohydrolase